MWRQLLQNHTTSKRAWFYSIILILLLACTKTKHSTDNGCYVTHITDGDTFHCIQNGRKTKVRMANIDAPEIKQAYGYIAKLELERHIKNQSVILDISKQDRYKRAIATVYLDNQDINLLMIQQGNAWVYNAKAPPKYIQAQHNAKQKKIGLWQNSQAQNPRQFRKKHK